MNQHLKVFSLAAATLLLFVSSPRPLWGTTVSGVTSDLQAQPIQDSRVIEGFKKTLASARELGDRVTELKVLVALGDAYNSLGKYNQAVESAKASLALAQELQNPQAKAVAFVTLASAYESLASSESEYETATSAALSGLTTAWQVKDRDSESKAFTVLGSIYSSLNEKQKALVFAQQGVRVAEENKILTTSASSLLTLAGIQLEEADYSQVIESTTRGIDYLQKLHQQETESAALVMLGLAYLGDGNSQKSVEFAEKGLASAQAIKTPLIESLAFLVLGLNFSDLGEFPKAIELLNQSRIIAKQQNNRELEALALEVIGGVYRNSGDRDKAIAAYQEAITLSGSYIAKAGLARTYQDANLLATAIIYYKQAINKNEEQVPRRIPGLPLWLKESLSKAVQDLSELRPTDSYRSLTNLLLLDKRMGEAQQVLELLKGQELREYTGNPKISDQPFSLSLTPTEEQIIGEYGSLIKFGYELDECQQTRCPQLQEFLEQRAVLNKQYYQALEQLEVQIRTRPSSEIAFVDPNQFALKAEEIVAAKPGTVLIYPLVLENKLWLMWASKGGIFKTVEVPGVSQSQLEVTVMKFRQLLQNRLSNIKEVQATGKQLYDWLIQPLEGELKANDIHNLVFSLDRTTRYIPIGTLFDGEKYLIENYSVSTVVSANLTNMQPRLEAQRVARMPSNTAQTSKEGSQGVLEPLPENQDSIVLGMGVSDAVAGFRPLPNVPAELDAIIRQDLVESQGIYPGQKFLNKAFNFFTLRDNLPSHELLHIATHSKFLPGRSNKSFLLLGTGEKLAIPDIENRLDLRGIDMVVLSACETALGGPGLDGKEIVGIAYYFLKGGTRTVVASLWNVDDQSTRLLMERFYANLSKDTLKSPVTKAEALRQAQLELLSGIDKGSAEQQHDSVPTVAKKNSFRHPYYWAPFILMGNGQ
jgi:CHAT domain-containing protein